MPALLARLAGGGGLALLAAATAFHWFGVPDARGGLIVTIEPWVTAVYKALCLGAVAASLLMQWRGAARERTASLLTLTFIALLFFPYFVMTWSPAISARASWLNAQHENLSWLGGDIFNEQEYKDIAWKNRLYVVDAERQVGVYRLPNWSPYLIQWGRLPDLLEWLGYSNRFCQFVCRGWFAALAGSLLALLPLCRGPEGLRYRVARSVGFTGLAAGAAAALLALTPPMASGWMMMRARHAVHRGDREQGLYWLEQAARALPVIRQDTWFLTQVGTLERPLGRDTLETRLQEATLFEQQGFTAQARERFERLVVEAPPEGAVCREAARALVRAAIADLNSGAPADALTTLLHVLALEPCNLKALYTAQLAGLRTGRPDVVQTCAERMCVIYARFNALTKAPVLAACYENLAFTEYQAGHMDAALAYRNQAIGR